MASIRERTNIKLLENITDSVAISKIIEKLSNEGFRFGGENCRLSDIKKYKKADESELTLYIRIRKQGIISHSDENFFKELEFV